MEIERNPKLREAELAAGEALANMKEIAAEVQAACPHTFVCEAPPEELYWFPSLNGRRICPACGIEEEAYRGYHPSYCKKWMVDGSGSPVLGSEFVKKITREELYGLRVRAANVQP